MTFSARPDAAPSPHPLRPQRRVMSEGTHFRIPWLQTPHIFDVRIRPRNISSATGTKDLQVVTINLRVLSRPEEEFLPDIFSNLGVDYDERVLPSIGNEVLKAVVAQYNAESLITKREMVSREVRSARCHGMSMPRTARRARGTGRPTRPSACAHAHSPACKHTRLPAPWPQSSMAASSPRHAPSPSRPWRAAYPPTRPPAHLHAAQVREALTKRANEFHIKLDDVAITDLKFGKEFTAAIESKQVAEQDAERARFLVEKSEQEKRAAVIRAEGESTAAAVVSEALKGSPALVELRRIEAAKDIAETLSKSRNVTYLPSGGNQNMLLNLGAGSS